jgi:hypothetical protein
MLRHSEAVYCDLFDYPGALAVSIPITITGQLGDD